MLAIIISLLGAARLHARPRASPPSPLLSPRLALGPVGPSRVSWALSDALASVSLTHHAPHHALASSSCTHLGLGVSSYTPQPGDSCLLPPARLSSPLAPRLPLAAVNDLTSMVVHHPLQLVVGSPTTTTPLVPCGVSRQHVGIVSVKRGSSVPPVTNPFTSTGVAGGAKASTTCTTFGSLATTSSVGEPPHLPLQGHTSGLSIALAASTSISARMELPSSTTFTTSSLATTSSMGGPSHLLSQGHTGELSISLAPLTSTSPRVELPSSTTFARASPFPVIQRAVSQRAVVGRCAVMWQGYTSMTSCTIPHVPLHKKVGLIHLSFYHASTTSITNRGSGPFDEPSCSLRGEAMLGSGSFGSLALAWPLRTYHLEYEVDSLSYSCSFVLLPHGHWLEHLDYDLLMRRRAPGSIAASASRRGLAMVLSFMMDCYRAGVKDVACTMLYCAQAYSFTMCAWQDVSSSYILSGSMAAIANFLLAWRLCGFDILWCFATYPVCFLCKISECDRPDISGLVSYRTCSFILFWLTLVSCFQGGWSVCLSCSGNDPNCKGDNTCALALALVANVAVMAGTAGASKALSMGEDGKHILPLSWLQFLKPSILQTLVRLAQRAPTGTPVDITSLTIKDLSAHISAGTISVAEGRLDFLRRMSDDAVSEADLLKMKTICEVLPQRSDDARFMSSLSKLSNSGALQFVFALASQIVHKLSNSSKVSLAIGDASTSSSSALVSIELKRPTSSESFSYTLTVWQTLLCATGLANVVVTGPFVAEVVHDIIPSRGWKVALEHFLLYIQKIDSGVGWQLATATSLGSHDTFLHNAMRAAGEVGKSDDAFVPPLKKGEPFKPGATKPVWNGKFNSDSSARPCAAFNLGQDHKNLKSDGSCPFNHICDQWVSDKGKGGQCKASHSRQSCTNAAKQAGSKLE